MVMVCVGMYLGIPYIGVISILCTPLYRPRQIRTPGNHFRAGSPTCCLKRSAACIMGALRGAWGGWGCKCGECREILGRCNMNPVLIFMQARILRKDGVGMFESCGCFVRQDNCKCLTSSPSPPQRATPLTDVL